MSLAENNIDMDIETLSCCPICDHVRLKQLCPPAISIGLSVFAEYRDKLGLCRCRNCGFVFTNPRPTPALLDQFYQGCSKEYACHHPVSESDDAESSRGSSCFTLGVLKSLNLSSDAALLDYGTGSGDFLRAAISHGYTNYTGFDISDAAAEGCRNRGLKVDSEFARAAEHGPFDAITMNSVLEHIPDLVATLTTIREALASCGSLLILVPNARSFRARISSDWMCRRFPNEQRYRAYPIHLSYFTRPTLVRLLRRSGFTVTMAATEGVGLQHYAKWLKGQIRKRRSDNNQSPAAIPTPSTDGNATPRRVKPHGILRKGFTRTLSRLSLGEKLIFAAKPSP